MQRTFVLALAFVLGCGDSNIMASGGAGGRGSGGAGGAGGSATGGSGGNGVQPDAGSPDSGALGYHVVGNQVLGPDGQPHMFHGVDRPSLEWQTTGDHLAAGDYLLMGNGSGGWKANVVRVALNQDYWLSGASLYDSGYAARVDQNIAWAMAAEMDVILDLHWNDKGNLADQSPGQQLMADDNSVPFWREVATRYQSNRHVLFELYNEPHDVSWDLWRDGGMTSEGWHTPGMQALYDTVRGTGAQNLVLIGGLNWAFDLSGVPTHRISGTNIVYATHPYDFSGKNTPTDWAASFGALEPTDPIMVTEFGDFNCSTGLIQTMLDYWDQHHLNWSVWAWYVGGCSFPSVISDWNGTPNAVGVLIKNRLASY